MLNTILMIVIGIICLIGGYLLRRYFAEKKIQDAG